MGEWNRLGAWREHSRVGAASSQPTRRLAPIVLLGTLLAAAAAHADGILRDGLGGISGGRGGTNLAHGDNGALLHDNPAGVVAGDSPWLFELRGDVYQFQIRYDDPENHEQEFLPLAILPEITAIHRSKDRRWAAGIGLLIPGGFLSNYHLDNPILGRNEYTAGATLVKLLPALAFRVTDDLRVGAGLGIAWSQVQYDGPFFAQTGALAGTPTLTDWDADGFAPVWSLGVQLDVGETTIGVAYLSQTHLDLDGDLQATIPLPGGGDLRGRFDLDLDFRWPRSLGVGISRPLGRHDRFSMDVIWFDWSDAFDTLVLNLSDASNPALATLRRDEFPLRWNDSLSIRLGIEHESPGWGTLRAGYTFHANAIPDSYLTPLIPAHFQHMVALGLGRRHGPWTWAFALQVSFAPSNHVTSSALAGGDFDGSDVQGYLYGALFSITYEGKPAPSEPTAGRPRAGFAPERRR